MFPLHITGVVRSGAAGCRTAVRSRKRRPWALLPLRPRVVRVLLVTDLEGFTPMVQRLGDLPAQHLMRSHNRLLRVCLHDHSGVETAHTGDGVIAAFATSDAALACAVDMQRALTAYGRALDWPLRIRIGLHAGRPLPEEGRLFGLCVNIAVRVCLAAEGSCVLVSDQVRQLASSSAHRFSQRGLYPLKGISAPVPLHELLWQEA